LCELLLRQVEFGEQTVAFRLVQAIDPICEGKGFRCRYRDQHAATGRASFLAGHGVAGLSHTSQFKRLHLLAETPHQG
jgi:hypothetical protein